MLASSNNFREGKIRHIGLSAVSSTTLRRAFKIAPVAAVQWVIFSYQQPKLFGIKLSVLSIV